MAEGDEPLPHIAGTDDDFATNVVPVSEKPSNAEIKVVEKVNKTLIPSQNSNSGQTAEYCKLLGIMVGHHMNDIQENVISNVMRCVMV